MDKNKKQGETKTNRAEESQDLGNKENMRAGTNKRGGQSPK